MNKYRIGTDIPFQLSIIDSGVQLDLTEFTVKKVALYSDSQESFAGACTFSINSGDSALLDCTYPAAAQVYTGALRLVVILEGDAGTQAYDLADVFELVATSAEADTGDGTVTSATLTVSTLPISTVALILEACVSATAAATEAAAAANAATDGFMAEMERMRMRMTPLTLEAGPSGAVIKIYSFNDSVAREVEVSVDGGVTWETFTSSADGTEICNLAAGGTVMLRGEGVVCGVYDEGEDEYVNGCSIIIESGTASAYGNPMSLLDKTSFPYMTAVPAAAFAFLFSTYDGLPDNAGKLYTHASHSVVLPATTLADYCYFYMFQGCTGLTAAPALPATTLASNCYQYMFRDCTGLTTAPVLPATTLAEFCYSSMFQGCTGLTTAPALPATTLAASCYNNMFRDCTSLTTAPVLPATTLASTCYSYMFQDCTSLTTAPVLPATTLASNCYSSMFQGCTGLTAAPALPATTLASNCYQSMFRDCTGLTAAPELPATTLASYCYNNMFQGCTHLSRIKAMFLTTPSTTYTRSWVQGVAAEGVFVKNAAATWNVTGVNGIPSGWTVETATP